MYLQGKKGLSKKDRKGWWCDKILVHFKEFGPCSTHEKVPLGVYLFIDTYKVNTSQEYVKIKLIILVKL